MAARGWSSDAVAGASSRVGDSSPGSVPTVASATVSSSGTRELVGSALEQFEDPGHAERHDEHERDVAHRQRAQREQPEHREHGDDRANQDALATEPDTEGAGVEAPCGELAAS